MTKIQELKQLKRLEKEKSKPKKNGYFWYLMLILCVIYVVDELASNIPNMMQAEIKNVLFGGHLALMSILSALSLPMIILSLYKTLADKYGRKPLLIINTFGMGIGLLLVYLAGYIGDISGIAIYLIATCIINFFISNDMQVVYIMETAPENKRGTVFASIKSIACLGTIIIPFMRQIFMSESEKNWFAVYLVPGLIGITVSLIALLFTRESDMFLDRRIAFLKMSEEERKVMKESNQKEKVSQGGIKDGFAFAFRHKQLRWLFICLLIFGIGAMATQYYSTIAEGLGYTASQRTTMLTFMPITSASVIFLNGFLGDRLGRKKLMVGISAVCLIGFLLFFVSAKLAWMEAITGLMLGLYFGAYYSGCDNMQSIMVAESSPTNLRASILSAQSVINMVGKMLAMIVPVVTMLIANDDVTVLGIVCLVASAPMLALTLFFLITKVGETKNMDLTTVTGEEWDK